MDSEDQDPSALLITLKTSAGGAKRAEGELAEALCVEEGVRPVELSLFSASQAVGRGAGQPVSLVKYREFHKGCAP